jgi:hypothetical protein
MGVDGRGRDRGVAASDDEAPAGSGIFAALVPAGGENPGQNGGEEATTDQQGERMKRTRGTRSLRRLARREARRASESREGQNPSSSPRSNMPWSR